jgi:DNA polymerase-3 subunit delta'
VAPIGARTAEGGEPAVKGRGQPGQPLLVARHEIAEGLVLAQLLDGDPQGLAGILHTGGGRGDHRHPATIAAARLSGGDLELARLLLDSEESSLRQVSERAARAALADPQPAAPWRGLLDYATEAGEQAAAVEEERLLELGEGTGRGGQKGKLRTDAADQVKRTARRVRTHSLDLGLGLCAAWFRDLAAVAGGGADLVFNRDRSPELAADAEGLSASRAVEAVALVNDTRRRLGLNVSEDLALDALWLRLGALLTR